MQNEKHWKWSEQSEKIIFVSDNTARLKVQHKNIQIFVLLCNNEQKKKKKKTITQHMVFFSN